MADKPKILIYARKMTPAFENMKESLSEKADVSVCKPDERSLQGIDILVASSLSEDALLAADRLKAVFAYKTGVDDFPLDALRAKGVALSNSHADAAIVAEYAFALGLSLVAGLVASDRHLREGIWRDAAHPHWKSLFAMKAGLLGYGRIGQALQRILSANGIKTVTLDRGERYEGIETVTDLKALILSADILFCSLPKTRETDRLLGAEAFSLMAGKYLVNVGRGGVIDEKALYEALVNGTLAGAAIDTWAEEPEHFSDRRLPSAYPFQNVGNVILSPHAAAQEENGADRYIEDVTKKVLAYLRGEGISDPVDLLKGY